VATAVDEVTKLSQERERVPRKKRARKKQFTDEIYGARLKHEDARVVDDYARQKGLDRSDVVRLGMHQFALRQQMRFQHKSSLEEMQEQVFREHFAALGGQLDALRSALQELPQTLVELHMRQALPGAVGEEEGVEPVQSVGRELPKQRRALEQALFASVLTLRLVTNYLVEPQLRRLDAPDGVDFEPHLRAAAKGKEAWGTVLGAVMKLTGERVMSELGFAPTVESSGTDESVEDEPVSGARGTVSALSDADLSAIL
jgi:hypothetical protein